MRYLFLYTEDTDVEENEICHELKDILKMHHDFAKNIYSESDLSEKGFKPLEILIVIDFRDGRTEAYSAMKWEMYFD